MSGAFFETYVVSELVKNAYAFNADRDDPWTYYWVGFTMRTGILYQVFSCMMKNANVSRDDSIDFTSDLSYTEYAIRYIRMHFRENLKIFQSCTNHLI